MVAGSTPLLRIRRHNGIDNVTGVTSMIFLSSSPGYVTPFLNGSAILTDTCSSNEWQKRTGFLDSLYFTCRPRSILPLRPNAFYRKSRAPWKCFHFFFHFALRRFIFISQLWGERRYLYSNPAQRPAPNELTSCSAISLSKQRLAGGMHQFTII